MAKFSSKAASALEWVLKGKTLVDFPKIISVLEADLRNKQAETASVEQAANQVLTVETYADGSRMPEKGAHIINLTANLDEEDVPRAIAVAKSVYTAMAAARKVWLLEQQTRHEAGRYPKRWNDIFMKNKGPGVTAGEYKG